MVWGLRVSGFEFGEPSQAAPAPPQTHAAVMEKIQPMPLAISVLPDQEVRRIAEYEHEQFDLVGLPGHARLEV